LKKKQDSKKKNEARREEREKEKNMYADVENKHEELI
jgi:hypothetical protein